MTERGSPNDAELSPEGLSSSVFHDLNNTLTAVLGNLSLIRLLESDRERTRVPVADAEAATRRVRVALEQLRAVLTMAADPASELASGSTDIRAYLHGLMELLGQPLDSVSTGEGLGVGRLPVTDIPAATLKVALSGMVIEVLRATPHSNRIRIDLEGVDGRELAVTMRCLAGVPGDGGAARRVEDDADADRLSIYDGLLGRHGGSISRTRGESGSRIVLVARLPLRKRADR